MCQGPLKSSCGPDEDSEAWKDACGWRWQSINQQPSGLLIPALCQALFPATLQPGCQCSPPSPCVSSVLPSGPWPGCTFCCGWVSPTSFPIAHGKHKPPSLRPPLSLFRSTQSHSELCFPFPLPLQSTASQFPSASSRPLWRLCSSAASFQVPFKWLQPWVLCVRYQRA